LVFFARRIVCFCVGVLLVAPVICRLNQSSCASQETVEKLLSVIDHPNVRLFLNLIALCEGTNSASSLNAGPACLDDYHVSFTWKRFPSFSCHPGELGIKHTVVKNKGCCDEYSLVSSAAGRYQFITKTWHMIARELKINEIEKNYAPYLRRLYKKIHKLYKEANPGCCFYFRNYSDMYREKFNPFFQDLGAVYLLYKLGVLDAILLGKIERIIPLIARLWASFPDKQNHSFFKNQKARSYSWIMSQYYKAKLSMRAQKK